RSRRVVDDGLPFRQIPVGEFPGAQKPAAEAALEKLPAVLVEEDERALPRVGQRDGSEENLVAERGDVELPGEGQAEIVEGLELDQPRADFEVRLLDQAREAVSSEHSAEHEGEEGREVGRLFGTDAVEPEVPVDLALGG